jgi:hypothetical protein
MWNSRHALISSKCSWCNRIWTGEDWVAERRPPSREIYANGICIECAAVHFTESQARTHLNVERFRMRPQPRRNPGLAEAK